MKLYLRVYAPNDADAPPFAVVELTPEFLSEVKRLAALCARERLDEVGIKRAIHWHEDPDADEVFQYRMEGDTLTVERYGVSRTVIWRFSAAPRHCDYYCTTDPVDIEELAELMAEATAAGRAYIIFNYFTDAGALAEYGEVL